MDHSGWMDEWIRFRTFVVSSLNYDWFGLWTDGCSGWGFRIRGTHSESYDIYLSFFASDVMLRYDWSIDPARFILICM